MMYEKSTLKQYLNKPTLLSYKVNGVNHQVSGTLKKLGSIRITFLVAGEITIEPYYADVISINELVTVKQS